MEDPSQLLILRVKTLCEHVERLTKQVAQLQDENTKLRASPPPTPPPSPSPATCLLERLDAL